MSDSKYSSHAALQHTSRSAKAKKIIQIVAEYRDLSKSRVLDIGTGSGHIAHGIAQVAAMTTSVNITDERVEKEGYNFQIVDSEYLPFADGTFDVVVSNHVIEHLPNHELHIQEIHRVLKKDGLLYLATPNKYSVMEPHFKLPFLSWLPNSVANTYAKTFRKKEWDVYPLTKKKILKLTRNLFEVEEWSMKVMQNLRKFDIHTQPVVHAVLDRIPAPVFGLVRPIVPTFIMVLLKK